jgi:hypothetical protein
MRPGFYSLESVYNCQMLVALLEDTADSPTVVPNASELNGEIT